MPGDVAPPPASASAGTLAFMLRAFRYRNYRLFFGGQIISLTGTWISMTATSWLVYRLTGSALLLGVVGFASQFPSFLLTPFAGIYVDRWNRHRLLVGTQTLLMLQSFVLAALTLTGLINMPSLIALSVVQGMVNAFDLTARQAFVVHLVEDRRDLANAIALNSSMFNSARLVGPAVGGGLIAISSEGLCFLIDGISFLAVIGTLLAMRVQIHAASHARGVSPLAQFKEGWRYTYTSAPIRAVMLLVAFTCLVGVPYTVLLPVVAARVLGGGAGTLGFLMAAAGGGALLGALWMASRRSLDGLSRLILVATTLFGCGLIAFSFSRVLWIAVPCVVATSAGFMVQVASSNTLIQTIVEDNKRGRVLAFFLMAYFGTTPFGSVIAGVLSERIGVSWTLTLGGTGCLLGAAWFAMRLDAFADPLTAPRAAARDAVLPDERSS